ncbi:MAG: hypothetical protein QGI78_01680 [Phycisphaerales bacterium]|nr:hypothetical protein [Phycisphaerales bacterium]
MKNQLPVGLPQNIAIAILFLCQFAIAQKTDHYNSLQTISYAGEDDSFQQNVRAIVRSTTTNEGSETRFEMAFEGGINYPSAENPSLASSEELLVVLQDGGKLKTEMPSMLRTISVINDGVDWAKSNALPENRRLRIPVDLGNTVTSYATMVFDSEPVDIGASDDTRLVTVRALPRRVSGRSGVFECQYKSIFIYSPKLDQFFQSTSVFTAKSGQEQLRIEEQTFLTSKEGGAPRYPLVSYENRLGRFAGHVGQPEMAAPPPPWVLEALTARESLYCIGKAIVYQKTNWVFVSSCLANTTYSLMNFAWHAVAGETLVASVASHYPSIGSRLQTLDSELITCGSETTVSANQLQLGSTVAEETAAIGARYVAIVPDVKPPPPSPSTPVAAASTNWGTTALIVGGGAGAAVALGGGSGGGGGGGGCSGNGLVDAYTATVSSPCMGTSIPSDDISFALNLLASCSVTGSADVYGTSLSTTTTTWSYNDETGVLTIGGYSSAVSESATTFTTPLKEIFPAVAAQIEAAVDLLPPAEIQEIRDNCGTVSNYVADLQMTWVR